MKIRNKFSIGFIITFAISFLVLNFVVNKMKVNFILDEVKEEMNISYRSVYRFTNSYCQYKLLELTKENLLDHIPEIAMNISEDRQCELYVYDENGQGLYNYSIKDIDINYDISKAENLLDNALENKNYLDINYNEDTLSAATIFPLYVYGNYVCTMVITKDFTDYFVSINNFVNLLKVANLIIFLVVIILLYLLSWIIVKPLIRLRKSFKDVEAGNYDAIVSIKAKDEIGELAKGFSSMKEQIKMQIETINNEKEKVLALQESKTEFFNNVTHELKTPLTTISGYSQILMGDNFDDDEFHDYALERIEKESDRMHRMVCTLIDVSKNSSTVLKEDIVLVSIKPLLEEIISDLVIKADKYKLSINYHIEDIAIKCIEDDIKGLFINLIDNAIKYSITNTEIEVDLFINDDNLSFNVKNLSDEISEKGLERVFQPFYRENIKKSRQLGSNGLGLFICSKIVEKYNGKIEFSYNDGIVLVSAILPIDTNCK